MSPVLMWVLSLIFFVTVILIQGSLMKRLEFNRACNFCTCDDRFIHRKLYRHSSLHSICTCDCVSRL